MKLQYFLALCLMAGICHAGDLIPITVTDTVTNVASATADTGTYQVKGLPVFIEQIQIDLSGHLTPNIDLDITSTGVLGARTLFSIDDIAADGVYPVRDLVTTTAGMDIANTPARLPLIGDLITVSAYDSDSITNVNVSVKIVTSKMP